MTDQNYRGYFFGNMYLSSLQQGLQAAHVIQKMSTRYSMLHSDIASKIFFDWCNDDRTIILLNGGTQRDLQDLASRLNLLTRHGTTYPLSYFEEEESALNGAVTSVGIILAENVYDSNNFIGGYTKNMSKDDMSIYELITTHKLAY